ncbi:hypothetical protein HAX54_030800 [Datura stramonium]|uniref:Mei2-like C-terminal RNA recognition motif domain-containing protein n=1 Tax=Datura stramonium TaxID=4076 RepID=A0ABS8SBD5_DATST|nr:hypothetical protein [Datura stramonium]
MAAAVCTRNKLNPHAEEFKPTDVEKDVVVPFVPQGNEIVLYQQPPQYYFHPPAVPSSFPHPYDYQFCYYQQQNVPFYWIYYKDFQPHYQQLLSSSPDKTPQSQSFFDDKDENFSVGMKKIGVRSEKTPQDQSFVDKDGIFSVGMRKTWTRVEKIKGQNKRPFLPPRLMRATATVRGRPKGFFLRKPYQETGSISSYKSPPIKEDPSYISSNKTTVMIRNIPNQFRRVPFMLFLDHYCRVNHWEYDFLYLPIDFGTKNNVGYAFVNFTSGCAASEIREVLKNFKWHGVKTPAGIYSSRKICEVTWARIQGKEQLMKHFSGSNFVCDTDEYLPVVFSPPRNGSTNLTKPMTIGKLAPGPSVSSSLPSTNDD